MNTDTKIEHNIFTTKMLTTIVDIVVKKYIKTGYLDGAAYEDTKQNILEKYYAKKDRIESLYDGRAKPETYLSAVVYRMLLEILRSNGNRGRHESEYEKTIKRLKPDATITPEERAIIENEKRYLSKVMATFDKQAPKAILFCKMFFRIMPTENDIENYAGQAKATINTLAVVEGNELDKDIFAKLCEISNIVENKTNKPDAVRMYVNKTVSSIVARMNGNGRANYNEETLSLLFDMVAQNNAA